MRSPVPDDLEEALSAVAPDTSGATAQHIPQLATADQVVRRLTLDGHAVHVVDPEGVLPDPDPGDGGRVVVVHALDTDR